MSRQRIRNNTDIFLNEVPSSSSYEINRVDEVPSVIDESSFPGLANQLRRSKGNLTGVAKPVLPMEISIATTKGQRIVFTMLVAPENVNHGKTHSVAMNYTRKGYVTQHWGPNQDILTATGRTAAFMVEELGLTNILRKRSFAFLNFMALVQAYKNNGYRLLDASEVSDLTTGVVNVVNGVEIAYDNQFFMGHFSNFTLDEDGDHPYLLNYNFEFVISSLSSDYQEVRGHFIHIPPYGAPAPKPPRTVEEAKKQKPKVSPTPATTGLTNKVSDGKYDALEFGPAFAEARKELGPGSNFEWRGKSYNTNVAS